MVPTRLMPTILNVKAVINNVSVKMETKCQKPSARHVKNRSVAQI